MNTPEKPSPQAVSAFLAQEFTRWSKGRPMRNEGGWVPVYPGFKVENGLGLPGKVRHVVVTHILGSRDERLSEGERKEVVHGRLNAYRKHLEERYRVTTEPDENGDWDVLLVWSKSN